MGRTVLLIATFDTKEAEALFLKERMEAQGLNVLTMDTGILASPRSKVDITQIEVAHRGGMALQEAVATGDKGKCILNMVRGAEDLARELMTRDDFMASSVLEEPKVQKSPVRPCVPSRSVCRK
jgi:uncharacterized protein (UPF0261 family)